MTNHWIEQAIIEALSTIPLSELRKTALAHEGIPMEHTPGLIRPSLLADPCPLARVKKALGHEAQPGYHWETVRNGRPNAGTALNYYRGMAMEGLVIAAIEHTSYAKIIAKSPGFVIKGDWYEAHPDALIEYNGQLWLLQIKNPNVHYFRHAQDGQAVVERNLIQVGTELYFARKSGLIIDRAYILAISWETLAPRLTQDHGINMLVGEIHYTPEIEATIDELIRLQQENVELARQGHFPQPYPETEFDKYPCAYCPYSRIKQIGIVSCVENEEWNKIVEFPALSAV